MSDSFWDIEASGQEMSAGGTGLTTEKMQNKTTFVEAGWDFKDTWYMRDYPALQWQKESQ